MKWNYRITNILELIIVAATLFRLILNNEYNTIK